MHVLVLFLSNYYPGTAVLCFRLLSAFSGVFLSLIMKVSLFFVYHEEISGNCKNIVLKCVHTIYKPPQISLILFRVCI